LAITSLGFSEEQAEQIYNDTKGYLEPILRHQLLKPVDTLSPQWAKEVNSDVLFAILFVTEWDSNNQNDNDILSKLSGISYDDLEDILVELSKKEDSPIRPVGKIWQIISKIDLWFLISSRIDSKQLERVGGDVKLIYSDLDPSFNLNPEERFMANIKGIKPLYSKYIKEGISTSLAMLSEFGDSYIQECRGISPSQIISYWISEIFQKGNDSKLWYSLEDNLPYIAEAAPNAFLNAVEIASQGAQPVIKGLFDAEGDEIFGGCPHANLLWSLEVLAWSEDYFTKSVLCLARLSEIDHGGRYSNRPFKSLTEIFLGWVNNTQISHKDRLTIIKKVLIPKHADISWKLMIALLPHFSEYSSGTEKPIYRDWANLKNPSVLNTIFHKYVEDIVEMLMKEVEHNFGSRLPDLLSHLDAFNETQRNKFVKRLLNYNPNSLQFNERRIIIDDLRKLISQHKNNHESDWAWKKELIDDIESIFIKFEFKDLIDKNLYIFDNDNLNLIELISDKQVNLQEEYIIVQSKRVQIIDEIINKKGFDGIIELAIKCKRPENIGQPLSISKHSEDAIPYVENWLYDNKDLDIIARKYISFRSSNYIDWAIDLYNKNNNWTNEKKSVFLLCLPLVDSVFNTIDNQNPSIQNEYWTNVNTFYFNNNNSQNRYIINNLLKYNRAIDALDQVFYFINSNNENDNDKSGIVAEVLLQLTRNPAKITCNSYKIKEVIEYIQKQSILSSDKIMGIEWLYINLIHYIGYKPVFINNEIVKDPSLFVQLVTWMFYDKAIDTSDDINNKSIALMSNNMLDSLSVLPGFNDNTIELNTWISQTRNLLKDANLLEKGDYILGEYLARCPNGNDGIWPHEAVRDVIEEIRSKDFERGFFLSKLNSRGTTWRSPYDGGKQERDLKSQYENDAEKLKLLYPHTAAILCNIADHYYNDALYHDNQVKLEE
jgi:hypothetical protein